MNKNCQYYPCHEGLTDEQFDCEYCYCPAYFMPNCGGDYKILTSGIKDCSDCVINHTSKGKENYRGESESMAELSENAMKVLEERYLRKDEDGNVIETPEDMFKRVADFLADGNLDKRNEYFYVMDSLDFLPNTPTLINAGSDNAQLSACFVLPVEDSMEGIFDAVKNAAIIHKTGGGTGFSFSRLRPKGSRVASTGGEASGVVSFLRVFNEATNAVKQGGVRRGANMGMLRVDHPDIEEFITCKDDPTQLTNFNLSVAITDKFMENVEKDRDWVLIDSNTQKITKTFKARELWGKIVYQAWKNGEPGIVFIDRMNAANPTPALGDFEATNPCGEQPLLPYESCNLGSINLANHVTDDGDIDWKHLEETVRTAVDFLNDVIDHNTYPLKEIEQATLRTRKIGLGVMGFADMLIKMRIRYGSPASVEVAKNVMSFIKTFANTYELSWRNRPMNKTITTIAPTGTISMIAGVSSGIEPNFAWVCDKKTYTVHPFMADYLVNHGLYDEDIGYDILNKLSKGVPVKDIPELSSMGEYWVTSSEILPEHHVDIQSAFQKYTDNAVSKTINLPNSASATDVANAFNDAYKKGCKGITVYRDGSRDGQVLNSKKDKKNERMIDETLDRLYSITSKLIPPIPLDNSVFEPFARPSKGSVRPRPDTAEGFTTVKHIGCGKLYVTVNKGSDGKPIEVFTNTGKAGGCPAQSEGLARMVSLALRYDIPLGAIRKQLCGIRCMSTVRKEGCDVTSCPDAIGKALANIPKSSGTNYWRRKRAKDGDISDLDYFEASVSCAKPRKDDEKADSYAVIEKTFHPKCPECGAIVENSEGCVICRKCGWSKCS